MQSNTNAHLNPNTIANVDPLKSSSQTNQPSDIRWDAIESYFKNDYMLNMVRHQIESYNHLIDVQLEKTIKMFNPIHIRYNLNDSVQENHQQNHQHSHNEPFRSTIPAPSSSSNPANHTIEIEICFENYAIFRPQIHENNGATKIMFPQEARARNFTYSSSIMVDVHIKYKVCRNGELNEYNRIIPNISIGKIPIMLKSNGCILKQYEHFNYDVKMECRHDPGGYFIINGSEKTVLSQERAAENKISIFNQSKTSNKWLYIAEIKSVPSDRCISPKHISMYISTKMNEYGYPIYVSIPRLKHPVPLFILFKALGVCSDKRIAAKIVNCLESHDPVVEKMRTFLAASMFDANQCMTQADAIKFITSIALYIPMGVDKETGIKRKQEYTHDILSSDLFPHCNSPERKLDFLGHMANQLVLAYIKKIPPHDRDSYNNKRIDTTGTLLNNLFRNYFNKVVKDMQKTIVREINSGSWRSTFNYENIINLTNIYKIIKSITIETGIKRALSTGDFGIKNLNSNKVGVAQVLGRLNFISSISHLRRINTPIDKSGKLVPPRQLHPSSWGYLCPVETPEGQSVGVVKNLSFMTQITIASLTVPLLQIIETEVYTPTYLANNEDNLGSLLLQGVKVFLNGSWLGIAKNAIKLYHELKEKKYRGEINIFTSIVFFYEKKEIYVCNEAGRLCRPLFRVCPTNKSLLYTHEHASKLQSGELLWNDLVVAQKMPHSVIEYLDVEEQMQSKIAMHPDMLKTDAYTHCELHPSTIFGVLASCIPFPEHNQSPRLTYQCAMGKQAMGIYATNYSKRMDKTAYILCYPMRPLVDTRLMNMLNINKIPSGCQVIVAIMTHTGYNQEDSIIFNQGSIDRGLFHAIVYHTEKDEDKNIHGDEEIRCKPNRSKTRGMRHANYDKLNEMGNIPEDTLIEDRDIIMAKVVPIKENKNDNSKVIKYEDHSRTYRTDEECYVDKIYMHRNGDGYRFNKLRIRTLRKPVIGDKFSSRGAQKGTIGTILPEENVPFTKSGLKPDIIINPHCMPSRMTIGQLKETLLGKVMLELGLFGDGTSFTNLNIDTIRNELQRNNYHSNGDEILYDGVTGEQIEMPIFIGPTFYQRLKHMVNDKCHSRNIGPMVSITRQPAEGRSRDGGLRFGEMERDCMISHGATTFIKTRMYDCSDKYQTYVCNLCGMFASINHEKHIHVCHVCRNTTDFSLINIPYACKLLFHELLTMNVAPRVITQKATISYQNDKSQNDELSTTIS